MKHSRTMSQKSKVKSLKYFGEIILLSLVPRVLALAMAAALLIPEAALAAGVDVLQASCGQAGGNSQELCNASGGLFGAGGIWENIINTLIFIIGAVSVLMIIVGGLRYITSAGDESAAKSAKNTIIYAVVGLVLAIAAGAIIQFVLTAIA